MAEKKETIWLEVTRGFAGKFGYLEAEEQAREAGRVNAQKRFIPRSGSRGQVAKRVDVHAGIRVTGRPEGTAEHTPRLEREE